MIPYNPDDGDPDMRLDILCQHTRFLWKSKVRKVSADDEDIGSFRSFGKKILQRSFGTFGVVDITHGRDSQRIGFVHSFSNEGIQFAFEADNGSVSLIRKVTSAGNSTSESKYGILELGRLGVAGIGVVQSMEKRVKHE